MTPHSPKPSRRLRAAVLLLPALILAGCSGPATRVPPVEPSSREEGPVEPAEVSLEIPASLYSETFTSADYYLLDFDWMSAEAALAALPRDQLAADELSYLTYLEARIAFVRGNRQLATRLLLPLESPATLPAFRYRALNLHRHMESLAGNHLDSARLGHWVMPLTPASGRESLRREIWLELQRAGDAELGTAFEREADPTWRGWLELALLVRDPRYGVEEIELWRDSHPTHPAADPLPGGMEYLLEYPLPPDTVALILPLSDSLARAGQAVRDGYLANYYAARALGRASYDLLVIDQDLYPSADAAYDEAVLQGAGLVIGPLARQSVEQLARRPDRMVPVLALNRAGEADSGFGAALVQMSLSSEDEAARLAELAFGRGARRAAIIRPATSWGSKVEEALRIRWRDLGGSIASDVAYGDREDHSSSVKAALGIPASEDRARAVRDMLATNIEFTARRRRDIDAVFLLAASGAEARSLKPLLAFHYAGSIPVYSTSSIYSGIPDSRDRDLDGINLVEMPWLLGTNPELRVAIAAGDTGSDVYTRLNALGADAFLLQQDFAVLQAGPDALLRGNTGLLSMDSRQRILRDLFPAAFDGGELKPR